MDRNRRFFISLLIILTLFFMQFSLKAGPIDKPEFAARRARFIEKIPDGVAIILGAQTPTGDFFRTMTSTILRVLRFLILF